MPEIIPAILTDDKKIFKEQIEKTVAMKAKTVQIDFTDGLFVSSKTLLPDELDSFVISHSELTLEAHLMTQNPEQYFSTLYALGFRRVAPHFQTLDNPDKTIALAKDYGLEIGIAINPGIELESIEPFVEKLDFILFLTVIPGEQGHPFEEPVLEKIRIENLHNLNNIHKNTAIEADGGINKTNITKVIEAGAARIVIGSGIWKSDNPAKAFKELQELTAT